MPRHSNIRAINRIIDVNINRAKEGLRVCEEITRFILNSRTLTTHFKIIRHKINAALKRIPPNIIIRSRESLKDVGKEIYINELKRKNYQDIFFANIQRAKESIRVLEEFTKLINTDIAVEFKRIRYYIYETEKKLLGNSHLYAIIDKEICKPNPNIVTKIKRGGIEMVQYRNKISDRGVVLKEAYAIRKLLNTKTLFIINDYLDVAKIVDCDGVHLGQDDPSIEIARKILGKDKIIGISCHNLGEAQDAQRRGADYISIGPIFPTPLKYKTFATGLEILNKVNKIIKIPIFPVGGINEKNVNKVLTCGAKRIAVCRAICQAGNVERAIKNIKKYLVK